MLAQDRFNVTELTGILGVAQSSVSRHLGLLKDAGLVTEEREAGFVYYRLADDARTNGHAPLWALLDRSSPPPPTTRRSREDEARLQEVLRHAQGELRRARRRAQLVPGRSWAAWARALGHLLPPLDVADIGCGEGYLTLEAARWARTSSASIARTKCSSAPRRWRRAAGDQRRVEEGRPRAGCRCATLRRRRAALPVAAPRQRSRARGRGGRPRPAPGGRLLILDLRAHDQAWVRARFGDHTSASRADELDDAASRRRSRRMSACQVGASKTGDPFTVLVASGTKPAARIQTPRSQRVPMSRASDRHDHDPLSASDRLLASRILMLDGAMGTMIQQHQLTEDDFRGERFRDHPSRLKGNNDLLVLTRPDVIAAIHHAYLEAGADIVETNTFSEHGDRAGRLRARGARLRAERRGRAPGARRPPTSGPRGRRTGRGSSPARSARPTGRCRSRLTSTTRRFAPSRSTQVRDAYREQVRGLIDGGADLLLLETIFDTLNAKAAIAGMLDEFEERGVELPVMISVTITDRSGRTLSGQTLDAFYVSIRHARPFSVGLNCALGASEMRPYVAELSRIAESYVTCYPNAGLPNAFGEYDEAPDETARAAPRVRRGRLRQHRRRLLRHDAGRTSGRSREAVEGLPPRPRARIASRTSPSIRTRRHLHAVRRPRNADHPARQRISS